MPHSAMEKDQWNFSYLSKYEDLKRAAVFYEYARHNEELVAWIKTVRELRVFPRFTDPTILFQPPDQPPEMYKARVMAESAYLSYGDLSFFVICESFPDSSFETAIANPIIRAFASIVEGGSINGQRWSLFDIPRDDWSKMDRNSTADANFLEAGYTVHLIAIPWSKVSNAEIVEQFRSWMAKNRPEQFKEQRKIGRQSGESADANTKLDQLAALRFNQHGYTREGARSEGFEVYASKQRWQLAINEAWKRVREMYRCSSGA